ncbi:MAG: hypothetical protein H0U73_11245 [Tatlockia sp.]|nr:hypothetical protein [Tatlockia sp.]
MFSYFIEPTHTQYYCAGTNSEGRFQFFTSEDNISWNSIKIIGYEQTQDGFFYKIEGKNKHSIELFIHSLQPQMNLILRPDTPPNSLFPSLPITLTLNPIEKYALPNTLPTIEKFLNGVKEPKVPHLNQASAIKQPVSLASENEESACCSSSWLTMRNLGLFVGALGGLAVAVAFAALNVATLGTPLGVALAVVGFAALLTGAGLFAVDTYRNNNQDRPELTTQVLGV